MFGKTLKVVEYNLTFGSNTRMVNVFGCFRYKKNGNLYVIYADVATKYEIINYGSSHVRNNNILSMVSRTEDQEIIKEFIYKIINNEDLTDFEVINLNEITGIEIVGSNHLEVKLEVIKKLEELTIPSSVKPEQPENTQKKGKTEETTEQKEKKKKSKKKLLLVLLIIIIVIGGGYFYLSIRLSNTVSKKIICNKVYNDSEIKAVVTEVNTYNFYNDNELSSVDTTSAYKFNSEESYQDFTYRGLYYKYMPDSDTIPEWDDTTYTFKVTYKKTVDTAYNKPTNYEEVINYYSSEGYSCVEEIEEK